MFFADMLRRLFLLTFLLAMAWSDISEGKIKNSELYCGLAFSGLYNCVFPPSVEEKALAEAFILISVLFLLWRFGLIGGGDVRLLLLPIWAFPDRSGLLVIIVSFPTALILFMAGFFRKKGRGIPFAVCVFISAVLVFARG